MDMGTAMGSPGWRTGFTGSIPELLAELYTRVSLAIDKLDVFDEYAKYFHEKTEAILRTYDLPREQEYLLLDFTEKLIMCLYRAYPQAEAKLKKLWIALDNNTVTIRPPLHGKKGLYIQPLGEEWHVQASRTDDDWKFFLPIYRISEKATFPDILNLSGKHLQHLQSGWRASDELDDGGAAAMTTTQGWQVFAWSAVRFGAMRIYLAGLSLNMYGATIRWNLSSLVWRQQWRGKEGKKQAQKFADRHLLGLLTWYLGDGDGGIDSISFRICIGNKKVTKPKEIVPQILKAAYRIGYGQYLDILDFRKWKVFKQLAVIEQHPVRAELKGYTFWLTFSRTQYSYKIHARTALKDPAEAERLAKSIAEIGIHTIIYTWKDYYILQINTREILKLVERYKEWRKAIKALARKQNLKPKTPTLRRLLELAENPPQPKKSRRGASPIIPLLNHRPRGYEPRGIPGFPTPLRILIYQFFDSGGWTFRGWVTPLLLVL